MNNRQKKSYSIKVVEKALDILEAVSHEKTDFSISHIAKILDISRASTFRLMATLEHRGYVEKSSTSDKYHVGVTALETSQNLLMSLDLMNKAKPIMEKLARECDETVYLCIPKQDEILLLDMVTSSQKVQVISLVGRLHAADSIAAGKVVLAHRDGHTSDQIEYRRIRHQGYAIEQDCIDEGISSVAMPIFDKNHRVCGSLCLIGPSFRMTKSHMQTALLSHLLSAGDLLSLKLGHTGLDLTCQLPSLKEWC